MSYWTLLSQEVWAFPPGPPTQLVELFSPRSPCSPQGRPCWLGHGEAHCPATPSSAPSCSSGVQSRRLSSDGSRPLPGGQAYLPSGHRARPWGLEGALLWGGQVVCRGQVRWGKNAAGKCGELDWWFSFPNFTSHCKNKKKCQPYRNLYNNKAYPTFAPIFQGWQQLMV